MPRDEVLEVLTGIWAGVLATEVRPETDFFEEGGQSAAVLQMINLVEERWGLRLSVREIFEKPTLGEFADVVRSAIAC